MYWEENRFPGSRQNEVAHWEETWLSFERSRLEGGVLSSLSSLLRAIMAA